MNTRTRAIASFFSVAMAAMLLGAVVTSQIQSPPMALAKPADPAPQAAAARPSGALTFDTFRDIARRQTPGVVNISTKRLAKRARTREPFGGDDLFERFFGPQGEGDRTQRNLGSGFVVDKDGYILTNRHVIDGADTIQVRLSNEKTYEAKLVGKDTRTDVAVVKIDAKEPLTVLPMGDSDKAEVGEWVVAIGSPFNLGGSVTVGVVSFKGRGLTLGVRGTTVDMIQTDAAINPGNSGGPLLNTAGEVIGINTLIFTQGVAQSSGVGFAVPINVARDILPQLREKGKVARGWLGISIQAVTEDLAKTYKLAEAKGASVGDVTPGSPADKAGVQPDDVIVGVDGRKVQDNSDLTNYVASRAPGTTVKLDLIRKGANKTISVTLGTFPEEAERTDEEESGRTQLGMTIHDLTPSLAERLELPRGTRGVVITDIEAGGAAEDATPQPLQRGDVIVSVNGAPVESVSTFEAEIQKARKESGVARLRVRRNGGHQLHVLRLP